MTENEINEMAVETARMHTLETIETAIRTILGDCEGAKAVLDAMEKPSYQILKRAKGIKRQEAGFPATDTTEYSMLLIDGKWARVEILPNGDYIVCDTLGDLTGVARFIRNHREMGLCRNDTMRYLPVTIPARPTFVDEPASFKRGDAELMGSICPFCGRENKRTFIHGDSSETMVDQVCEHFVHFYRVDDDEIEARFVG